jgi:regulator of protease activity HflC (stomatin/prohibitin superfamily)
MSSSGPASNDAAGHRPVSRRSLVGAEQAVERISMPSARLPEPRSRRPFNRQAWWGILLLAAGVIYLATGLGFQHEYNRNTVIVFGEITQQAPMPWYYGHPWFGAFVLAGLPALAFAWLIVTLLEARFTANELRAEVADLSLHLQHAGYRLQGQLDQIADQVVRRET